MGRSKFGNAERKGWNEDICQLNVLSRLEGSKEKADTPQSNCSDWHNTSFLPHWISPWYSPTHKGDGMMTKTVVSATMIGGIQLSLPTLKRPRIGTS